MSRMWLMSGWTSSAQVSHSGWTMKLMKPTWGKVIHNIHHPENLFHHTWDFSTLALSLSHMADTSRPSAFSWNGNVSALCIVAPLTAHPVSLRPELVHEPVHPLLVQWQRLGRVGEVRAVDHVLENLGKFKSACQFRNFQIPIKLPGSCR